MKNHRTEKLKLIRDEILNLKSSPLYEYRVSNKFYPVIGQGNHFAKIFIIAEAPGLEEAECGRPFVGKSGKILNSLLKGIDLKRKDIYITNILKDRPPNNRNPKQEEIDVYAPFLKRQIQIIQPKLVITLGKFAMEFITELSGIKECCSQISQSHGKLFQVNSEIGEFDYLPLYHPAVVAYTPSMFDTLERDFKNVKKYV